MGHPKRSTGAVLTLGLLLGLAACDRGAAPTAPPLSTIAGRPAAPPVYTDFDRVAPLFAQRNDTTYLVNFWATWCRPCLDEIPLLLRLSQKYRGRPIRIVLLSLDTKPGDVARIPDYLADAPPDLPTLVLSTPNTDWGRTLDEHWTGALPTTIVYRNELRYVYRRAFRTLPDLEAAVTPLLQ